MLKVLLKCRQEISRRVKVSAGFLHVIAKIQDETPQKRLTKCRKNTWLIISSVRAIYPVYNEISIMGRQIADYELIHIQSLSLFAKIITTNICYIVFYHYICTVFMMYEN
nr:MAG TPA: hypothetical protein [Caudoviricetes sp.]